MHRRTEGNLASSLFVKPPQRIMALAFVMTRCLLIYKLAKVRLRPRLAQEGQMVPDQKGKPPALPTLRWLIQCFVGAHLHHTWQPKRHRCDHGAPSHRGTSPRLSAARTHLGNVLLDLPGDSGTYEMMIGRTGSCT